MEDLPIGAEIILKVVKSEKEECNGCFFNELDTDIFVFFCKRIKCTASERKDRKNVQFKRVK